MFKNAALPTLLVGFISLTGCRDDRALTGPDETSPHLQANAAFPGSPGNGNGLEARFHRLAIEIPSFAGYFYDRDGNLVVYLAGSEDKAKDKEKAKERLHSLIANVTRRGRAAGHVRQILFRDAQYTFAELTNWRDRMLNPVLEINEVVFIDADEALNRVTVGVRNATGRIRVDAVLDKLGIPGEAVNYTQAGSYSVATCDPDAVYCDNDPCSVDPSSPECQAQSDTSELSPSTSTPTPSVMPAPGTELWSYHERLQGGIGITRFTGYDQYGNIGNQLCTGFPAKWNGRNVFITNSHCTERFFGNDTTPMWQPVVADPGNTSHPWVIGKEVHDPDTRAAPDGFRASYAVGTLTPPWSRSTGAVRLISASSLVPCSTIVAGGAGVWGRRQSAPTSHPSKLWRHEIREPVRRSTRWDRRLDGLGAR